MRASVSVNSVKKSDTLNVSVNPVTNVSVQGLQPQTNKIEQKQPNITVEQVDYSTTNPYENIQTNRPVGTPSQFAPQIFPEGKFRTVAYEDWDAIVAENKALKLVIDIMNNNPLIVNKYIIADDETLMDLIKTLTQADEVQIDADDLAQGCITTKSYRKVHNVFIIKNNSTLNLKYDFPAVLKLLLDLKISIKYVY